MGCSSVQGQPTWSQYWVGGGSHCHHFGGWADATGVEGEKRGAATAASRGGDATSNARASIGHGQGEAGGGACRRKKGGIIGCAVMIRLGPLFLSFLWQILLYIIDTSLYPSFVFCLLFPLQPSFFYHISWPPIHFSHLMTYLSSTSYLLLHD